MHSVVVTLSALLGFSFCLLCTVRISEIFTTKSAEKCQWMPDTNSHGEHMHGTPGNDLFKPIPLQAPCPCQLSLPHYLDPSCTAEPSLLVEGQACPWSPAFASSAHQGRARNSRLRPSPSHTLATQKEHLYGNLLVQQQHKTCPLCIRLPVLLPSPHLQR